MKNPCEFPHESFVEKKVKRHFENKGAKIIDKGDEDIRLLIDKKEWITECKGKSAEMGLDFNTGLGQLLKRMESKDNIYALALPDIEPFRKQIAKVPIRITNLLKIRLIWVDGKGKINI